MIEIKSNPFPYGSPDKTVADWSADEKHNTVVGAAGENTAVAMMAAGWDGCQLGNALGFSQEGSWTVSWEGLHPMI